MTTPKVKNKAKPGVKIILDGKERTLKFDLNALEAVEDDLGINLFDGTFEWKKSVKLIKTMLWACLLHENETLTKKEVGSWIHPDNMKETLLKLDEAFEVAMPESEGKETVPLARKSPSG